MFNIYFWWSARKLNRQLNYHYLRRRFIAQRGLNESFDFALYLEKCLQPIYQDLVEIHWSTWLIILTAICINWTRFKIFSPPTFYEDFAFLAGIGYGILIISLLLLLKCYSIYHILNQHISSTKDEQQDLSSRLLEDKIPRMGLFWFNSPIFLFRAMQTTVIFQIYYMAAVIIDFSSFQFHLALKICLLLPSLFSILLYAPYMISMYVIIANVEEFGRAEMIQKTLNASLLPAKRQNIQSRSVEKDDLNFP